MGIVYENAETQEAEHLFRFVFTVHVDKIYYLLHIYLFSFYQLAFQISHHIRTSNLFVFVFSNYLCVDYMVAKS